MSNYSNRTLEKTLIQITETIRSGIKHGFFDCQINCEIVKGNKRKITIKTGKSYQHYISEDDFEV